MIYTDDPRRLLKPTDQPANFTVETIAPPVSFNIDRQDVLAVYFDPFEAQHNPGCPICYGPIHRLRLFDVIWYTIDTPPFTWVSNSRRNPATSWRITASTRAAEFSPCPHVVAPFYDGWWRNYAWPTPMASDADPRPMPRERWARPAHYIAEQTA